MAIINKPEYSGFSINDLAPEGTWPARCLDVKDQFGFERKKYDNPQENETLDITTLLFGVEGPDGKKHRVQSRQYRISGHPQSNLVKDLSSWMGKRFHYGLDTSELIGEPATITVTHRENRDGTKTYANITSIGPVIELLRDKVPALDDFKDAENTTQSDNTPPTTKVPVDSGTPQQPYSPVVDQHEDAPY